MSRELWQLSALTLAEMVRSGEASSREVVDAHLARIDEVNAAVNAVVEVRPDEVRASADASDAARRAGADARSLCTAFPSASRSTSTRRATPRTRAWSPWPVGWPRPTRPPVRAACDEAGALALARTNMPDLGLRLNTESSLYGATHNPWRAGLTVGGSSGGWPPPSRRGCARSRWATTSAGRCATRRTPAASRRSSRHAAGCRGQRDGARGAAGPHPDHARRGRAGPPRGRRARRAESR